MKTLLALSLSSLLALPAYAQSGAPTLKVPTSGKVPADFIPAGYQVLNQAAGDLNGDGRADAVLVLTAVARRPAEEAEAGKRARLLLVLFSRPGGYVLADQSTRAVLCRSCAPDVDPFDGLTITKGQLLIGHQQSSGRFRNTTARFRYQQGHFYLIGETDERGRVGHCDKLDTFPDLDYRDTNFLTGEYEVKRISDDCRLLEDRRSRNKPQPLRALADYSPDW